MEETNVNKMNESIETMFDGISALADTKKVIGEPKVIGDTIIVPFLEVSMGMGVGNFDKEKNAGGMGCKVSPIACLVIQNGVSKFINIHNQDSISKAIDLIPDLVNKLVANSKTPTKEVSKAIKDLEK